MAAGDGGQFGHRLDRAYLVVGVHDRYEGRAIGHQPRAGRRDRRRRCCPPAGCSRSNPRRASDLAVCSTASCSIAETIRCRRPDGSRASAAPRRAALSPSVPPAVKTISGGSAPSRAGHRGARLVERGLGLLAEMVDARRVAPGVARHGGQAFERGRDERGRRVVVEVDARHCPIVTFALTRSNKRGRQAFRQVPILAGLRSGPLPQVTHGEQRGRTSARIGRHQQCGSVTSRQSRPYLRHRHLRRRYRRRIHLPSPVAAIIANTSRGGTT